MTQRHKLERQPLGLDEIMIVNPGATRVRLRPIAPLGRTRPPGAGSPLFLADDGVVYVLQDPGEPVRRGDIVLGTDGAFRRVGQLSAILRGAANGEQLAAPEPLDDGLDLSLDDEALSPQVYRRPPARSYRRIPRPQC